MQNVIKISNEESVSSDFIGESHSCIFDEDSSIQLNPNFFKIICWYENEYSYANRVADSILFCEKQIVLLEILSKMTYVRPRYLRKQDEIQQTDCYKKEISVSCCEHNGEYESDVHPKLTCSTCQEKENKVLPCQFMMNPLITGTTSLPTYTKTNNELLKIWTDANEISKQMLKMNLSSSFQGSLTIATPNPKQTEGIKPQTRLENVKREFSKMVNITEDLLKKAQSNQSDIHSISKNEFVNKADIQLVRKRDTFIIADTERYKTTDQNYAMDNCGDCKSLARHSKSMIQDRNNIGNEVEISSYSYEKEISDFTLSHNKVLEKQDCINHISKSLPLKKEVKINTDTAGKNSAGLVKLQHYNIKDQLAKTDNTVLEGLAQNIQLQHVVIYPTSPTDSAVTDKLEIKTKSTDENFIDSDASITTVKQNSVCDKKVNELTAAKQLLIESTLNLDHTGNLFKKYKLNNDNANMKLIDEKLRKRNIVLLNNPFVSEKLSDKNIIYGLNAVENAKPKINMNLEHRILEEVELYPETAVIASEDTSRYDMPENSNTTISNRIENKEDIYDKLDSASATDSNNSFEINERKSQVIHITDLTNSFEDLARLDKICRIIEISDELSDELFSALDNKAGNDVKNERWSFRDLCERIQLDRFCNKVFGKLTV
ncbi:Multivalent antigen sj97-GAPDH [Operophtera brumata]|uniref:Multivalent antigen sj97-GAPDH n=1 Tax=Operophtera brumata TaxID=104452 RepID=A0A0L7LED7_OPEBR|nr:Multivalent antigen sj97-GAPDH [Operophtera brumata]